MNNAFISVLSVLLQRTLIIRGNVAGFLFGVFGVESGGFLDVGEGDSLLFHQGHQVVCEVSAGEVHFLDGVG